MTGAGFGSDAHRAAVFFHAHPDDEALLTAGTMARLVAAGRRVVLVLATAGESGLSSAMWGADGQLGSRRLAEVHRSAAILGVHRVEVLDYRDSGLAALPTARDLPGSPPRFIDADLTDAADRLAQLLVEESAGVLTTYDINGGYGHPDHRQVHAVGARAAVAAGTPRVLEATLPREPIVRLLRWADRLGVLPADFPVDDWMHAYTPLAEITHRIDVHGWLRQRRAAMRAHLSQTTADQGLRTLGVASRLPSPLFGWVFGAEWYRESGSVRQRATGRRTTIFEAP